VNADGTEPIVLVSAPEEATANRGRSIVTGRKRRGHDGDCHVGNDGHQDEEEVLHDGRLERSFSCSERCVWCLVFGVWCLVFGTVTCRLPRGWMAVLEMEEVVESGRLKDLGMRDKRRNETIQGQR